jgi:hypothetical protein
MATRDELVVAVQERYANGERREKTRILDEFVAVTGFHRKHAVRVLRRKPTAPGAVRDLAADFMMTRFAGRWF